MTLEEMLDILNGKTRFFGSLKECEDKLKEIGEYLEQVVNERNFAVEQLRRCSYKCDNECEYCKNIGNYGLCNKCDIHANKWEWCGVHELFHKELNVKEE